MTPAIASSEIAHGANKWRRRVDRAYRRFTPGSLVLVPHPGEQEEIT